MARTTKKTETEVKEEKVVESTTNKEDIIETKLAEKDKEIAEMKAMLLQMQSMLLNTQQQSVQQTQSNDEYVSIYKQIPVVSLCNGILNLTTTSPTNPSGKVYTFSKFGEVKNIVYSDVREIVSENYSFAIKGLFYILDERVVQELGLNDYYKDLMTKEQLEDIIEGNTYDVSELFKTIPNSQKETLVNLLVNRMANGIKHDLNKIALISELYGKDLQEMTKDFKFLMNESSNVR